MTQGRWRALEPARAYGRWRLARSDVVALTFVHYGKQAVNPLARHAGSVLAMPCCHCGDGRGLVVISMAANLKLQVRPGQAQGRGP